MAKRKTTTAPVTEDQATQDQAVQQDAVQGEQSETNGEETKVPVEEKVVEGAEDQPDSDTSPEEPEQEEEEGPVDPDDEDEENPEQQQQQQEQAAAEAAAQAAAQAANESQITDALNKDAVTVPAHLQFLRNTLDAYLRDMAPNAIYSPTVGIKQARLLHNLLDSLFRQSPEHFIEAWSELVSVIKANRKGCFSEQMVFRGWHENALALRGSRRQRYEGLITLLLATADSGVANAVKMLDVNGICKRGLNETESAKLLALYGA